MAEAREYLIRKDGYFYRPNKCGYTTAKFDAGRYTKADAEAEASVEPWHMSAVHQDDVPDDAPSRSIKDKDAEIEKLRRERDEAAADRDRWHNCTINATNRISVLEIRESDLREAIEWELNILEMEVRPVVKESKREWLDRRIGVLRRALARQGGAGNG